MPVVYVIHADEDRAFVETRLIRPLPALGFDRWHSSAMFPGSPDALPSIEAAMRHSAAILAVVPKSLSVDQRFGAEVDAAVASAPRIIPVFLGPHTEESASPVVTVLRKYGGVDAQETAQQTGPRSLSIALGRLLPLSRPADALAGTPPRSGAPIGWNEGVFSDLLAASLGRHDDSRSESLVATLARYLSNGPDAYRVQPATADSLCSPQEAAVPADAQVRVGRDRVRRHGLHGPASVRAGAHRVEGVWRGQENPVCAGEGHDRGGAR